MRLVANNLSTSSTARKTPSMLGPDGLMGTKTGKMGGKHFNILIVEDDPSVLRMMDRIVSSMRYGTILAGSSIEALDRYKKEHGYGGNGGIDLVITDFCMPKMDGLGLLQSILDIDKEARVIIVTGAEYDYAEQFRDAGARDILGKPFTIDEMKEVIARNLP